MRAEPADDADSSGGAEYYDSTGYCIIRRPLTLSFLGLAP